MKRERGFVNALNTIFKLKLTGVLYLMKCVSKVTIVGVGPGEYPRSGVWGELEGIACGDVEHAQDMTCVYAGSTADNTVREGGREREGKGGRGREGGRGKERGRDARGISHREIKIEQAIKRST